MNKSVGQKSTLEAERPKPLLAQEHPSQGNHFLSYSPHPLPDTLLPAVIQKSKGSDA